MKGKYARALAIDAAAVAATLVGAAFGVAYGHGHKHETMFGTVVFN